MGKKKKKKKKKKKEEEEEEARKVSGTADADADSILSLWSINHLLNIVNFRERKVYKKTQ